MVASVSPRQLIRSNDSAPRHPAEFWQHRWVQNVLPLATSLIVHLSILAIGIALYRVVTQVKPAPRMQQIVPASAMIPRPDLPTGLSRAGSMDLQLPQAMQNQISDMPINGIETRALGGAVDFSTPGGEPALTAGLKPAHSGGGIGAGMLGEPGGGFGQFGAPRLGGNPGVDTPIFKDGAKNGERKMIFLCDASGSMLGVFGALKQSLRDSVNQLDLTRGAQFNIIFFSDDRCMPLFRDGTQMATPENKKQAMEFIDNAIASGGTQPIPAIKFALAEKPDLLFVLTDGFDQIANFDEVVHAFKAGNSDGKIRINTIFLESDQDPQLEKVLKQIAGDGKGTFTKLRKQDM